MGQSEPQWYSEGSEKAGKNGTQVWEPPEASKRWIRQAGALNVQAQGQPTSVPATLSQEHTQEGLLYLNSGMAGRLRAFPKQNAFGEGQLGGQRTKGCSSSRVGLCSW